MLAVEADCGAGRVGDESTPEARDHGNPWAELSTEGRRGKAPGIYLLNKPVCSLPGRPSLAPEAVRPGESIIHGRNSAK